MKKLLACASLLLFLLAFPRITATLASNCRGLSDLIWKSPPPLGTVKVSQDPSESGPGFSQIHFSVQGWAGDPRPLLNMRGTWKAIKATGETNCVGDCPDGTSCKFKDIPVEYSLGPIKFARVRRVGMFRLEAYGTYLFRCFCPTCEGEIPPELGTHGGGGGTATPTPTVTPAASAGATSDPAFSDEVNLPGLKYGGQHYETSPAIEATFFDYVVVVLKDDKGDAVWSGSASEFLRMENNDGAEF